MDARSVIVVILAYGLWGTSKRSPKEIVGYGMYLNECANALRHLAACGYGVNVVFCGGATDEEGKTEAQSMFAYMADVVTRCAGSFFLEEESLTTPANIWQAYKRIANLVPEPGSPDRHVIFLCDAAREFKVRWLVSQWQRQARNMENRSCRRSWSPLRSIISWPKPEILAFNRPDITHKSTKVFQFFETMVMVLAPWILQKRISKIRETEGV